MAKNNNYKGKKTNDKNNKKQYKNPTKSIWGKVIIVTLALAMCLLSLVSLIYAMINAAS